MFRKILLFIFVGIFIPFYLSADILLTLPSVTAVPGAQIQIPVKIYGADASGTPICAADIRFTFDTAALTYTGVTNFNPLAPQSQWFFGGTNGLFSANWLEPNLNGISFPDGSTLFEVKFTAKPGACSLAFSFTEFLDDGGMNIVPSSGQNGHYASLQQVTFRTDMRDQTVGANGVHLAGSFNNWNTSSLNMTPNGDVYSVSQTLICDSNYTFRYINGNAAAGYETVPASCGVAGTGGVYNRSLTVPAGDTVLTALCFSSCEICPPLVNLSFRLDMSQQVINADGVHLAGDFNNWSTTATPMTNLGNNVFGATIQVNQNSAQPYRYVNGNSSAGYEIVPEACGIPATGGGYNRQVQVLAADTTLSEVCFSSCDDCPTLHNVEFRVDMSQTVVSPDGAYLAGSFNDFSTTTNPMTNMGNDVYTATISIAENDFITFRYVNGNTTSGYEEVPEACGISNGSGVYNRYLQMGLNDTILSEVCFSSCTDCVSNPGESEVVFKVDMSQQLVAPEGIHLAGSFNNWSTTANPMNFLGNGIYQTTLTFDENQQVNYRFVNGNTTNGYETVPGECGQTGNSGGMERVLVVPVNDTTLPEKCFSSCDDCPPAVMSSVTFRLNMEYQTVSTFGVHLAGSFNNWSSSSQSMTLNGDYYQATLNLPEGTPVRYRYVNGNTAAMMEPVPAACGVIYNGTDYARELTFTGDTLLGPVCFGECGPCYVGIDHQDSETSAVSLFPNPAGSAFTISFSSPLSSEVLVEIFDLSGRTVYTKSFNNIDSQITISTTSLRSGLYWVRIVQPGQGSLTPHPVRLLIIR